MGAFVYWHCLTLTISYPSKIPLRLIWSIFSALFYLSRLSQSMVRQVCRSCDWLRGLYSRAWP